VLNELQELVDNPDETDDLLRLGLHRLPIGEFPLLRSLASVLAVYDGAAELERGLDILLTGLASTLPLPDGARPSSWAVHPASRPAPHRPDTKGVRKAGASPEPTGDLSAEVGRRRTLCLQQRKSGYAVDGWPTCRRRLKTRQVPLAAQHLAQRIRFARLPCGRKAQVTDDGE
jgi:hypothetical protein